MTDILRSPRPGPRVFQQFTRQDVNLLRPVLQAGLIAQAFDIVEDATLGVYAGVAMSAIPYPDLRDGAEVDDFSTDFAGEPNLLSEVTVEVEDANGVFDITEDDEVTIAAAGITIGKALTTFKTLVSPTLVSTEEEGDEVTFPVGTDLIASGARVGDTLLFATTIPDLVNTTTGRPSSEVDSNSGLATEFVITAIPARNRARVILRGAEWTGFLGETNIEAHVRRYPAGSGELVAQDEDGAGISIPALAEFIPTNSNIDFLADPVQPGDELHFITDSLEMVGIAATIIDNALVPSTTLDMDQGTGLVDIDAPILAGSVFTDSTALFATAVVKAGDELRFITEEADLVGTAGQVVTRNIKRYKIAADASSETSLTLSTPLQSEMPASGKCFQYQIVRVNQPVAVANNKKPFVITKVKGIRDVLLDRAMSAETKTLSRQFEFKIVRKHVPNGAVKVGYRALRSDLTGAFLEVGGDLSGGMTDLVAQLGPIVSKNPIALMASRAVANTPNSVGVTAVTHMDTDNVLQALGVLGGQGQIYGIALASQDKALNELVQAHVLNLSDPLFFSGRERYVVQSLHYPSNDTIIAVRTSSDDELDIQGDRTNVKLGSSATIDFSQIHPGMLIDFDPLGTGRTVAFDVNGAKVLRSRQRIAAVLADDELQLAEEIHADEDSPIEIPWAIVTHDYTLSEIANNVAITSQAIGNRRIINLGPADVLVPVDGGVEQLPAYYMAAAIVARRSAVSPAQPLTQEPIYGFEGVVYYSGSFSEDHFSVMRGGGTWVLEQQAQGPVVSQHQLTTDRTSLQTQEDSIRTAIDYMAKKFAARFRALAGRFNLTQRFITSTCWPLANGTLQECIAENVIDDSASVTFVGRDENFPDHLKVNVDCPSLKPLNFPDITLLVS